MDLTYPAEAEEFRTEIRAWLEENLPEGWFDDGFSMTAEERRKFHEDWTQKLFDGGWICASWPKEYGGKGLSIMENVVLNEEFARAGAPLRADFFGDTLVGPTILQWGSEEQKQEFLPKILSGEIAWCQGFSEPDAGSDLAWLKTRAELDGDEWVINGQKIWTTQAQYADYIFLLARTDPERPEAHGHLLPARADEAGRHRGAPDRAARRLGRVQRGVLLERALPEGQRRRRAQQRLEGGEDDARLRARLVGHDQPPALREGARCDHRDGRGERRDRRPVGAPGRSPSSGPRSRSCGSTGYRTLTAAVHGDKDPGVAALGATNKMFWSETHRDTMELAIDILGPHAQILTGKVTDVDEYVPGYGRRHGRADYPVSIMQASFFFSRSETIWGGTAEIQRNIVGERVLGLPKEPKPG